jgi:hypothetical protein
MKFRAMGVPAGLLVLMACSTQSSFTVANTDPEALKSSPAGVSTFAFLDIMTSVPGLLGGSNPACVTPATNGTTQTLTFANCPSPTGGSTSGTVTVNLGVPAAPVITFNSLTTTRSATLNWAYAGMLDVAVQGSSSTITAEDGFQVTVTDTTKAAPKVWIFTCALTGTTGTGFTLQGGFSFTSGTTDNVGVAIDPANPLVWAAGGTYPVTGGLTLTDNRTGQVNRESLTAVFDHGTVTINGGTITLGH